MKYQLGLLTIVAVGALITAAPAQDPPVPIQIGSKAPPLDCVDGSGKALTWKECSHHVVVMFFHSQDMPYSQKALNEVCESLAEYRSLVPEVFLLLVTNGDRDVKLLEEQLGKTGLAFAVTVDKHREKFQPYKVIAFPTVFTLNKQQVVMHIDKGYGPLLKTKVTAAVRHAAGHIEDDVYRALVSSEARSRLSEEDVRINRTVRMVKHLVENGSLEDGRRALERVVQADSTHVEAMVSLVDILLRLKDREQAALWIGRLRKFAAESPLMPLLQAELEIQRANPDAALELLDKNRAKGVRAIFLRGCALEQKGQFEAASKLYRQALRIALGRGT